MFEAHQAGFPSVTAMMGSALSERQRRLLAHHPREITLLLDGDHAGRQASLTISAKVAQHCHVINMRLGENVPPDQLSPALLREISLQKGGQSQIH